MIGAPTAAHSVQMMVRYVNDQRTVAVDWASPGTRPLLQFSVKRRGTVFPRVLAGPGVTEA